MNSISSKTSKIWKIKHALSEKVNDFLAIEEPLQISISLPNVTSPIQSKSISITMRTPGNDKELGIGFLFTEGIIHSHKQLLETKQNPNEVDIVLGEISADLSSLDRHFYTSSSCGVCGKSSIDAIKTTCKLPNQEASFQVSRSLLFELPKKLNEVQAVFQKTGGLHAAALFDLQGNIITQKEDVGRHNALDKVIGHSFINEQLPLSSTLLLLSGRISFELVQKAYMAGIPFIMAVGAPSSLAVQLAEEFDITLVGFLSDTRFNVYHGAKRIKLD